MQQQMHRQCEAQIPRFEVQDEGSGAERAQCRVMGLGGLAPGCAPRAPAQVSSPRRGVPTYLSSGCSPGLQLEFPNEDEV